jgi:site-specific DNA recombinase
MSRSRVPKNPIAPQASSRVLPQHVALYMRVSTEDQADRGTIDAQRDFLRQFASLYQLPVSGEYTDDGISGTLPLDKRPEGHRLLQDAEAGRFGCVLVYRLTRLGRSLNALIDAHDVLSRFGVTIRSAQEPFDTSTPIGIFLFQLLGSLAQLDRAQVLEQLSRGRDRVARNGKWTDGLVPYGYTVDKDGHLTPSDRLVEVAGMTEADVVRELYRRLAQGSSATAESRRFTALAIPTIRFYGNGTAREGGKRWYPTRIAEMIGNPTYKGAHVYDSRYGAIEREVPALVEVTLWEQANVQLKRNQKLPKSNRTREYVLSGLIKCGTCRGAYVGQAMKYPSGTQTFYYRCSGRNPEHFARQERCRSKAVRALWLEDEVWQDCRSFILNPGEALAEAQRQLQDRQRHAKDMEQARAPYLQALADKTQERERVMTLFQRGRMTLQSAEERLDAIAQEEITLRAQVNALDAQRALVDAYAAHLTDARHLLEQLQARLQEVEATNDQATKRQVMETLIHHIRIDTAHTGEARATITYAFSKERVAANCNTRTDV